MTNKSLNDSIILFLDIDGVIATSKSYRKDPNDLDPVCIKNLNRLLDMFSFEIVVSSTWKEMFDFEHLCDILKSLNAPVISITKNLQSRDDEIITWLEENQIKDKYLVLDDQDYFLLRIPNDKIIHVKNGFDNGGFRKKHLKQAIEKTKALLNR